MKDLHKRLQSKECLQFLQDKLDSQINWQKAFPKRIELIDPKASQRIQIVGMNNDPEHYFEHIGFYREEQFDVGSRDGIIAGGAITAWLNEYVNQVSAIINDIDYFYYDLKRTDLEEVEPILYEGVEGSNYEYNIVKVTQEKIINHIKIEISFKFDWLLLLRSFDLNCTMVAFDPHKKRLIYHQEFLQFLLNREIKPHRGWDGEETLTTYIRAQKKTNELQAVFKMHLYMQHFIKKNLYYWWEKKQFSFKVKHKEAIHSLNLHTEYDVYPDESDPEKKAQIILCRFPNKNRITPVKKASWEELISVKKLEYWRNNIHLFHPWLILTPDNYVVINTNECKFPWFNFCRSMTYSKDLDNFLNYNLFSTWYSGDIDFDNKLDKIRPVYHQRSNFYFEQLKLLIDSNVYSLGDLTTLFSEGFNYESLAKEFSKDKLIKFQKFIKLHEAFKNLSLVLLKKKIFNYDFNEVLVFFTNLSRLELELIGTMEASISRESFINDPKSFHSIRSLNDVYNNNRFKPRFQKIMHFLEKRNFIGLKLFLDCEYQKDLDTELLSTRLNLPKYFEPFVRELNLASSLVSESRQMKHCIKGYGEKVKDKISKIFHLKVGNIESTLELEVIRIQRNRIFENMDKKEKYFFADEFYRIKEHKSYENRTPSKNCEDLADLLVLYLNNYNNYEEIWEKRLEHKNKQNKRQKPKIGKDQLSIL